MGVNDARFSLLREVLTHTHTPNLRVHFLDFIRTVSALPVRRGRSTYPKRSFSQVQRTHIYVIYVIFSTCIFSCCRTFPHDNAHAFSACSNEGSPMWNRVAFRAT